MNLLFTIAQEPANLMETIDSTKITILVAFILFFFFISAVSAGGERALSLLNIKDVNMLKARNAPNSKRIPALLENPRMLSVTILITKTICFLALIFILNALMDALIANSLIPAFSIVVKILVIFFLLAFFAEALPRAYAGQKKLRMAFFAAPLINGLTNLFEPLASTLLVTSDWIGKNVFRKDKEAEIGKEIDMAYSLKREFPDSYEGKNILRSLIQFDRTTVNQIMLARMDIRGIDESAAFERLLSLIYKYRHSKIPVYSENLDHIKGFVLSKEMLRYVDKKDFDWNSLIKPILFVQESKLIKDLLLDFQKEEGHIAIVVDEYGGTSGMVTSDDIMGEVVGDIRDEFDQEAVFYEQVNEDEYIFEGRTLLNEVIRILDLSTEFFQKMPGENNSLAGFILELSGDFPKIKKPILYKNLQFIPLDIRERRIKRIKIVVERV